VTKRSMDIREHGKRGGLNYGQIKQERERKRVATHRGVLAGVRKGAEIAWVSTGDIADCLGRWVDEGDQLAR